MFGVVEVDESLFGPRHVKGKRGRGAYEKQYIFMTPDGAVASHEGWRDFNMTAGFIDALRRLTKNDNGHETARAMLADYLRIMEQKFMTEKELDDLAEALWARYPDALKFLADSRPDLISKVFDHVGEANSDTLYERLDELGFDFSKDWDHATNSRLIYTFGNWDAVEGMLTSTDKRLQASKRLLWLELVKSADGIRALFIIGPGDQESRRQILRALIDSDADTGSQKSTAKMTGEYSTLGSVWLLRNKSDEHSSEDLEKLAPIAMSQLENFLADQLPKISDGLSKGSQ